MDKLTQRNYTGREEHAIRQLRCLVQAPLPPHEGEEGRGSGARCSDRKTTTGLG